MRNLLGRLQAMQHGGPQLVNALLGVGFLTVVLFIFAVAGALTVADDADVEETVAAGPAAPGPETSAAAPEAAPQAESEAAPEAAPVPGAPAPGATVPKGAKPGTPAGPGTTAGGAAGVPEAPPPSGEAPLPRGGSTVGVTDRTIKYGVHAPITFSKAPVPLAGPTVRGIRTYIEFLNANGGVNGRTITPIIEDDELSPGGAQTAANTLIHDKKVFFIAGTLGVDQIRVVASEAKKAGVPYFAGGGHEPQFKDLNVHQILSSYDTHVIKLAQFMGKEPKYAGKNVGAFVSDTPLINPVVTEIFRRELERNGLKLTAVAPVQKPEFQSAQGYGDVTLAFKSKDVQVVVPLTDPINTSGLVRQCETEGGCPWTYSFSDFAHDTETALTLFNDTWGQQKVRGLSGGCYPNSPDAQINNTAKCGSMGKAKAQFEKVRGAGAWTSPQSDEDGTSGAGYNSAAGYQWIGFWLKAMKDLGSEVTRERLMASINRYEGYGDLITGPITYKGSSNFAHGAEKMVVWEAQTGNKYKMISDGFVDGF